MAFISAIINLVPVIPDIIASNEAGENCFAGEGENDID